MGPRGEQSGIFQGQIVWEQWQEDRERVDRNGDGVLQYVMLEGEPSHQDALLRTEYSIKTLTNAGVLVEKLASDTANWNQGQAAAKMSQWHQEFGSQIEAVFANNDDMALGAIDVLLEAGVAPEEMPVIVGVDATVPALEAMAAERDDLDRYVDLFGYSPKYGVSGRRIASVEYRPQPYQRVRPLYEVTETL